ncbi:MAG: DnaJ domain-containing protein [Myxococcales bacterium]|nr:DnaJ domain-containing protein [Myxococcales bacterium]
MAEKLPRIKAGVDIRQFKLDPMDGFLLTRIDGKLGPKELSRETGIPDFSVERALEKLIKLGVVELAELNAPTTEEAPAQEKGARVAFGVSLLEPKYDPKELEEECDLPVERRKLLLDLFYRLDDVDHYTLLGLTREADKKSIKRAYFELASTLHPDRYFNKQLGSFKTKMEAVFERGTEAHDTLTDKDKREEYDAYLAEVATTRGMEAMLERALADAARVQAHAAAQVQAAPAAPTGPSQEELQARRSALAARLRGGRPTQASSTPTTPAEPAADPRRYASASDAVDALKRRYEDRLSSAGQAQARKYTDAAEEALSRNDIVAASSALSIAVKYAPEDVALAMRFQEVKNQADALLSESYTKQAQYEERSEHYIEAARSWERVAKLKPDDPMANDRAAACMVRASGDLHAAADYAKKAIALQPEVSAYRATLATVYLEAGLYTAARREAEAGLELEPKDPTLTALLKKAQKG